MTRIIKPTNFFRRYHQLIFGTFWFLTGITILMIQESVTSYLYIPVGLGMIIYGYLSKDKVRAFIAWDSSKIVIKDPAEGEKVFPMETIDNISISNNHLTIRSGETRGIILDLSGYENEDIHRLEKQISAGSISLI